MITNLPARHPLHHHFLWFVCFAFFSLFFHNTPRFISTKSHCLSKLFCRRWQRRRPGVWLLWLTWTRHISFASFWIMNNAPLHASWSTRVFIITIISIAAIHSSWSFVCVCDALKRFFEQVFGKSWLDIIKKVFIFSFTVLSIENSFLIKKYRIFWSGKVALGVVIRCFRFQSQITFFGEKRSFGCSDHVFRFKSVFNQNTQTD